MRFPGGRKRCEQRRVLSQAIGEGVKRQNPYPSARPCRSNAECRLNQLATVGPDKLLLMLALTGLQDRIRLTDARARCESPP